MSLIQEKCLFLDSLKKYREKRYAYEKVPHAVPTEMIYVFVTNGIDIRKFGS